MLRVQNNCQYFEILKKNFFLLRTSILGNMLKEDQVLGQKTDSGKTVQNTSGHQQIRKNDDGSNLAGQGTLPFIIGQ